MTGKKDSSEIIDMIETLKYLHSQNEIAYKEIEMLNEEVQDIRQAIHRDHKQ